jgi:hypothetical protein
MTRLAPLLLVAFSACASASRAAPSPFLAAREGALVADASGAVPASDRLVVKTAWMRLERSDPEAGVPEALAIAKANGGWVKRSSARSATLMVPADKLEPTLEALSHLGEVESRDVSGQDVTEEYRDLSIRLENLQRSRERFLALLQKAQNVSDAVAVERELERVTVEVERLKGRIQFLDQGVRHSTIDISFERPVRPGPVGWVFYGLYKGVKWLLVWN